MSGEDSRSNERSAGDPTGVVERAAVLFDVAALSTEEAIEVYKLLDSLMDALWREHGPVLLPMYYALLERLGVDVDGDDEDGADSVTSH